MQIVLSYLQARWLPVSFAPLAAHSIALFVGLQSAISPCRGGERGLSADEGLVTG